MTQTAGRMAAARFAVYTVFLANGALMGSWVPRIPEIKAELQLSPGTLGVVLLAPAIGAVTAMPFAGSWASRVGSPTAVRWAALMFCGIGGAIGLPGDAVTLSLVLLAWGAAFGVLDVVMNTQAVTVERAYGRSLMSGFHATFSLGALIGTGFGTASAVLGVDLAVQLATLGAVLLVMIVTTSLSMVPDRLTAEVQAADAAPLVTRPRGPQVRLAMAAFAVLLCEGATADWSAVYLREGIGSGPAAAGAGFAAFSATMTIGRLVGDRVLNRWPRRVVIRQFATMAALGLGGGLLVAGSTVGAVAVVAAVAGFGALGAGLSLTFPALLAEAGMASGRPAEAIAAVSTGGYVGFLVGPPMIGGVAQLAGLPVAIWLIPVLVAGAAVVVGGGRTARP